MGPALAVALATLLFCSGCDAQELTLGEVLRLADERAAAIAVSQAQLRTAQAEQAEARALLWNNPQLAGETRFRRLAVPQEPSVPRRDAAFGLSQTFETGGQPAARRAVANASLSAAQAQVEQSRRESRAAAAKLFVQLLAHQQRLALDESMAALSREAAQIVDKRLRAGEVTRLDANLALVEAERSASQLGQARDELLQAQLSIATALRLPTAPPPVARGVLEDGTAPDLAQLLDLARNAPRLAAAKAREEAARRRVDLERAARSPDVTVGLSQSNERSIQGTDRITTLSVSLPLPLFRNNAAAITRAQAELEQAELELRSASWDAEASVSVLHQRWQQARERAQRLQEVVVSALATNQRLSVAALRAGEINISQFLLAQRQVIEARREALDALAQTRLLHIELEAAAGADLLASASSVVPVLPEPAQKERR